MGKGKTNWLQIVGILAVGVVIGYFISGMYQPTPPGCPVGYVQTGAMHFTNVVPSEVSEECEYLFTKTDCLVKIVGYTENVVGIGTQLQVQCYCK